MGGMDRQIWRDPQGSMPDRPHPRRACQYVRIRRLTEAETTSTIASIASAKTVALAKPTRAKQLSSGKAGRRHSRRLCTATSPATVVTRREGRSSGPRAHASPSESVGRASEPAQPQPPRLWFSLPAGISRCSTALTSRSTNAIGDLVLPLVLVQDRRESGHPWPLCPSSRWLRSPFPKSVRRNLGD
jgi:hypothetical protein